MKIKSLSLIALFLFALLNASAASAQSTAKAEIAPAKRELIVQLLTLTRADKNAESVTLSYLQQMESELPRVLMTTYPGLDQLDAEARERLNTRLRTAIERMSKRFQEEIPRRINFTEVIQQIFVPLYDKFFNEEELRGLIAFYESPVGKKMVAATPQLMQEGMSESNRLLSSKMLVIVAEVLDAERENLDKEVKEIVGDPPPPPPPAKAPGKPRPIKKKK